MSAQSTLLNVLSVSESLDVNYTSSQLLSVLDNALFSAVEAILRNTDWMNLVLSNVITWYSENARRKISSTASKDEVYGTLISIILSTDIDYKLEKLKSLQLERSLWFKSIQMFINNCPEHASSIHNFLFMTLPEGSLYVARRNAQYWLNVAKMMKTQIMEKYLRYVGTQAIYAKKKNPDIDLEDHIQNLTVALSQAIDKCSSDRGTLTSYIAQWFMSAQTRSRGEEYGTAYSVPDSVRKEFYNGRPSNIYVPFQDLVGEGNDESIIPTIANDHLDEIEDDDERLHLLHLAKHADPIGFGRYQLGLKEILIP